MRYNEIINEGAEETVPGFNWPAVVQAVRKYIAAHTQVEPDEVANFRDILFNTDSFHETNAMDELHDALNSNRDAGTQLGEIHQALAYAIEHTGYMIQDRFDDANVSNGDIGESDMLEILKPGAGELLAYLQKQYEAEKSNRLKVQKTQTKKNLPDNKKINPANVQALVQTLTANLSKAADVSWEFFEQDIDMVAQRPPGTKIKRAGGVTSTVKPTTIQFMLDSKAKVGFNYSEVMAIKGPQDLFKATRAKLTDVQFINYVIRDLVSSLNEYDELDNLPPGMDMWNANWSKPSLMGQLSTSLGPAILAL